MEIVARRELSPNNKILLSLARVDAECYKEKTAVRPPFEAL